MTATKQYMKFDAFKKLILEATDEEENKSKVYWKCGLGWGITYDNWNVNSSNIPKDNQGKSEPIKGTFYYYVANLENKDKKFFDQVSKFLTDKEGLFDGISRFVGKSLTWQTPSKLTAVESGYKYKDVYKLYEGSISFEINIDAIKEDPKEVKNRAKSIEWNAEEVIAEKIKQWGFCAYDKLFINYSTSSTIGDSMMFSTFEAADSHKTKTEFKKKFSSSKRKNSSRIRKTKDDYGDKNLSEAIEFVRKLVEYPDKFGGYNKMLGNLKELVNMSTADFMQEFGSKDFFGALIVKGIMNLFKKKESTTPQFKPSKDVETGYLNKPYEYQVPEASGKPKEMTYSMEKTEISGVVFNPKDRKFKFTPQEVKDYNFTFYANNGATMAGEFNLTVKVKELENGWKKNELLNRIEKDAMLKYKDGGNDYSIDLQEFIKQNSNDISVEMTSDTPYDKKNIRLNNKSLVVNTGVKGNYKITLNLKGKDNKEIDSIPVEIVIESKNKYNNLIWNK